MDAVSSTSLFASVGAGGGQPWSGRRPGTWCLVAWDGGSVRSSSGRYPQQRTRGDRRQPPASASGEPCSGGQASWVRYRLADASAPRTDQLAAPGVARERSGEYAGSSRDDASADGSSGSDSSPDDGADPSALLRAAFTALDAGLGEVTDLDLSGFDQEELRSLLRETQRRLNRLTSFRSLASAEFEARAVASAPRGRESAAQKEARQGLGHDLRLPPNETKRSAETGKRLRRGGSDPGDGSGRPEGASQTRTWFERGDLTEGQASVITDALHQLPKGTHEEVERKLLDAARTSDPVALGRLARRLVAEAAPAAAREREKQQHRRRSASIVQTDDGAVRLSAHLFGVQAEKLMTAFHAFRRPDTPDEARTSPQRGADALEALSDAALKAGEAPTQHGERPHVLVIVEWSALARMAGIAELGFTGAVTLDEVRPLLADASFSRVVLDTDSVPIEGGTKKRNVPAGLWRSLVARDRGCSWEGCDAPPGWCQVAHGNVPFHKDGRLKPDNAALLCSRHHRRFDAGGWRMTVRKGTVIYERQDPRPPPAGGGPPGPGDGGPGTGSGTASPGRDRGADPPASSGGPPADRDGCHRPRATGGPSGDHGSAPPTAGPATNGRGDVPLPFDVE